MSSLSFSILSSIILISSGSTSEIGENCIGVGDLFELPRPWAASMLSSSVSKSETSEGDGLAGFCWSFLEPFFASERLNKGLSSSPSSGSLKCTESGSETLDAGGLFRLRLSLGSAFTHRHPFFFLNRQMLNRIQIVTVIGPH